MYKRQDSSAEGIWRFLFASYGSCRNRQLEDHRRKLEAKGNIESWFYFRARAIADGKPDPMPNVSDTWEAVLPNGMSEYRPASSPNTMRALIPIAALVFSTALPALAQRPLQKVGGCPYSYRSSGDYCMPSKSSKDAFIRTGNSCPNSYRKSGKYCIAN